MKSDNPDDHNFDDEIDSLTGDRASNPDQVEDSAHPRRRSTNQRRRLLVAALAGAPMIVAGSAQTAYAQSTASFKPSDPATRHGGPTTPNSFGNPTEDGFDNPYSGAGPDPNANGPF